VLVHRLLEESEEDERDDAETADAADAERDVAAGAQDAPAEAVRRGRS
jgi:hypothetical protein